MKKKFKLLVLGVLLGVTAFLVMGCSSNEKVFEGITIINNSNKSFNKLVVEIGTDKFEYEGHDEKDIKAGVRYNIALPGVEEYTVKAVLKKNGKTIATSEEITLTRKKNKQVNVEIVDMGKEEIELKVAK